MECYRTRTASISSLHRTHENNYDEFVPSLLNLHSKCLRKHGTMLWTNMTLARS